MQQELWNISIIFNELYMFGFVMKSLCFPLLAPSIFTSPPPHLFANSSAPTVTQYLSPLSLILSLSPSPSFPGLELHFHQRGLSCK